MIEALALSGVSGAIGLFALIRLVIAERRCNALREQSRQYQKWITDKAYQAAADAWIKQPEVSTAFQFGEEDHLNGRLALCEFKKGGYLVDTIKRIKYQPVGARVARVQAAQLARQLEYAYLETGWKCSVIVPAPASPKNQRRRGFNQCVLLAEPMAKRLDLPVRDVLRKHGDPQVQASRVERQNVKVRVTSSMHGESVLLVDDIVTTGATMQACALALKRAGASSVYGVSLATVLSRYRQL